jgi:DNA recombination protein RmuC
MPDLPLNEIAAGAAVAAAVLAALAVLFLILQSVRSASLARLLRDENDRLRSAFMTLDQGLRQEIANGIREALSTAFDKVQDGLRAQSEGLERFGRTQRETIDLALQNFGEQQGSRLAAADATAKAGNEAVQAVLLSFKTQVSENLERTRDSTDLALTAFAQRLTALDATLKAEQEQLRALVATQLDAMRAGNEAKLEEMRKAVDEKLQSALEKQLKDSFTNLQEQLASVQQAIGQVQSVAGEVGDLKRLFSNVKSRGGWGEAQLEAMLTDILPVGAFEKNFRVKENSSELVEFALRVPGRGGDHAWLAIDSKFPTEDYARLIAANDAGNREEETAARAALARNIRLEAGKIQAKYIETPRTLEFGILYVPSDSLFAEVARVPGLIEAIRRDTQVMVMGPSLLPAFLHTLRVSYVTLALEQKASEIGETLAAVKTQWTKFGESLAVIKSRADLLSRGIDETIKRQGIIGKRLRGLTAIEDVRANLLLGLDGSAEADDTAEDEPSLTA